MNDDYHVIDTASLSYVSIRKEMRVVTIQFQNEMLVKDYRRTVLLSGSTIRRLRFRAPGLRQAMHEAALGPKRLHWGRSDLWYNVVGEKRLVSVESYYETRANQELHRAERASTPAAKLAHLEMAKLLFAKAAERANSAAPAYPMAEPADESAGKASAEIDAGAAQSKT